MAVAEELHFGRAAARLDMAQPPLSPAIVKPERQLGVQLLERTTRQVALTPAGQLFLGDARAAIRAVRSAARRARQYGRKEPSLRLALKADHDAGLLPLILRAYADEPESLPVELVLGGRGEQVPALRDGGADVALLATPFDSAGLEREELLTEKRVVALGSGDELATVPELTLNRLAGRVLPDGTPAEFGVTAWARTSYDSIGLSVPSDGPSASSEQGRLDLAQIFSLVELGRVVLFVPASVAELHSRPDIVYRDVTDLALSTLTVAWPENSRSPALAAFVRVAVTEASRMTSRAAEPVWV